MSTTGIIILIVVLFLVFWMRQPDYFAPMFAPPMMNLGESQRELRVVYRNS